MCSQPFSMHFGKKKCSLSENIFILWEWLPFVCILVSILVWVKIWCFFLYQVQQLLNDLALLLNINETHWTRQSSTGRTTLMTWPRLPHKRGQVRSPGASPHRPHSATPLLTCATARRGRGAAARWAPGGRHPSPRTSRTPSAPRGPSLGRVPSPRVPELWSEEAKWREGDRDTHNNTNTQTHKTVSFTCVRNNKKWTHTKQYPLHVHKTIKNGVCYNKRR